MRLFKHNHGKVWYADIRVGGRRIKRSTRCTDKKAAEAVARGWERDAADPDHAATAKATLSDALDLLLCDREEQVAAGRKAESTLKFYKGKAGHWTRVLETNSAGTYQTFPLAQLQARHVDEFISTRRAEGAGENTINKELITLRASLKLAKRAGIWKGDVDSVLPSGFAPEYKPRERALTYAEAQMLLAQLPADRAARVAFIIATSANWNESERARRQDVADDLSQVLIRGTKRATRHRVVPIVSRDQRSLLEYALKYAKGKGEFMFEAWTNVRRDLDQACVRIEKQLNPEFDHGPTSTPKTKRPVPPLPFPSVSPNDLRRTCATWLRAQGAPPHLIAPVMGHADSRMVERVYGRLPIDDLARRLAQELGANTYPHVSPEPVETTDSVDSLDDDGNEKPRSSRGSLVPRDRIELPTRGFSILVHRRITI